LEHFGDVRGCLLATVDQMVEISGIGLKTAEAIREIIGGHVIEPQRNILGSPRT
jgi:ERCC4-type nuclease